MTAKQAQGAITVVTVRHDHRPEVVYIRRHIPARDGSPLSNPYKVGEHSDPIGRYRAWLWQQLKSVTLARRELERLVELTKTDRICCRAAGVRPIPVTAMSSKQP